MAQRMSSETRPRYASWFALPWYRHYTLNIDDLDEAVGAHSALPRELRSLSGQRDGIPVTQDLLSVHLNGRLRDFPDVTFSAPQYGQRLARAEVWYQTLVADLLNHPVLFVGTALEEPGLWQHIELRQQRQREVMELRPPSYLVSPHLPAARAALLKRFNIDWIEATEEEFFDAALTDTAVESALGHQVLSRRFHPSRGRVLIRRLSELRQESDPDDLAMFLLGREPHWKDLSDGYAIERDFEAEVLANAATGANDVVLITGTAGSGKSTTAMRLALALEAAGKGVSVLDTVEGDRSVPRVVAAVEAQGSEVVLIDDIEIFGERAERLLEELSELDKPPLVIAALRSSRLQRLDLQLGHLRVREVTVPPLDDSDIDKLIASLERANRLGLMAGMDDQRRRRIFREQCGRQLLVAMYKATSGESLHDRVFSECEDLSGNSRLVYGMAAIATAERNWILRDELTVGLAAMTGGMDYDKLRVVPDLIKRDLLVPDRSGLGLRHRWVAETAVEFYQANSIVGPSLKALVFALATKADPQSSPLVREQRLLHRLLNHAYLQRMTANIATVREVYSLVEDQLAWDYHYWLQRGSLEVETGDLALAENSLSAALSKAPARDFRVSTEFAYLLLKKAAKTPRAPAAADWAETAFKDLEHAMAERGKEDSYPFHIYGSQGLSWARRATMLPRERQALVRKLLEAVDRGRELHPRQNDLQQLATDLKKEYLMLAVEPAPGT